MTLKTGYIVLFSIFRWSSLLINIQLRIFFLYHFCQYPNTNRRTKTTKNAEQNKSQVCCHVLRHLAKKLVALIMQLSPTHWHHILCGWLSVPYPAGGESWAPPSPTCLPLRAFDLSYTILYKVSAPLPCPDCSHGAMGCRQGGHKMQATGLLQGSKRSR